MQRRNFLTGTLAAGAAPAAEAQTQKPAPHRFAPTASADPAEIFHRCDRWLSEHGPVRPYDELAEIVRETDPMQKRDHYGNGELVQDFEREVAALLGKEKACFFISGTMAQQILMRVWSERKNRDIVGMHPLSHPMLYELDAMPRLHNLRLNALGERNRLLQSSDLARVTEPLLALLIELPQRELGGQLPSWDDLKAQTEWARKQGGVAHLDGARLWESAPYYGKSYAEIAALFDTVYVSLYKGVGGIAGCCVAGPAEIIDQSRMWRLRHGGRLVHMYPYVLSARLKLKRRLPKFPDYHRRAIEIGRLLSEIPNVTIKPDPPQAHMMFVYLKGDRARLEAASLEIAKREGVLLFQSLRATDLPDRWQFEIQVGDGASAIADADLRRWFAKIAA